MANSLGAQQNSIVKLGVVSAVALAGVQIELEVRSKFLFVLEQQIKIVLDAVAVVLLANEIETRNKGRKLDSTLEQLELCLDLVSAHNLESSCDEAHLEQRSEVLNVPLHILKKLQLVFQRDRPFIVE